MALFSDLTFKAKYKKRPPGSNWGLVNATSPSEASIFVRGVAVPPDAGICIKPCGPPVNRILPSAVQTGAGPPLARHKATGVPPERSIRQSCESASQAIDLPSGDQDGKFALRLSALSTSSRSADPSSGCSQMP